MDAPPVSLDVQVDVEDLVAFHRHFFAHLPTYKKSRAVGQVFLIVLGMFMAAFGFIGVAEGASFGREIALFGVLLGVIGLLLYRSIFDTLLDRRIRKHLREVKDPVGLGRQHIEVRPDGIFGSSSERQSLTPWHNVSYVAEPDGLHLVYVGTGMAFVIRASHIVKGELDQFVEAVENHIRPPASP